MNFKNKQTPIIVGLTLLAALALLLGLGEIAPQASVQAAPQSIISTFPYTQDFETFSTCSTSAGATCTLPGGSEWVNATDDDIDWTVDVGGTPSSNTGPSVDHTLGTTIGHYLYTEASSDGAGHPDKVAHLITPEFSLPAGNDSIVSFWYHMVGVDMGTMHVDISTNSGGSWQDDIIPSWTDQQDLWQEKIFNLSAYAGQTVQLRIRGITGDYAFSDMAIDDFSIHVMAPAPDVFITKSTPTVAALGNPVVYTLAFSNTGTLTATNVLITDIISNIITNVTYQASGAAVTPLGGPDYTWQVADLAPGAGGTIIVSGVVSDSLTLPLTLTNTATITATNDYTPLNNRAVVTSSLSNKL